MTTKAARSASSTRPIPPIQRWLRRHANLRDLGLLAFAFLLGRSTVLGLAPLSFGSVVAARAVLGSWSVAVAVSTGLGLLSVTGVAGVWPVVCLLAAFPLWGLARRLLPQPFVVPLLAGLLAMAATAPTNPSGWMLAVAMLLASAAALALSVLEAPLVHRDSWLGRGAAMAALGVMAGAGLVGVRPLGLDLAYAGMTALTLLALLLSPGGSALGALAGLVLYLRGDIALPGIVDLALASALALLGRGFGRLVSAALFLLGDLMLAAAHSNPDVLLRQSMAAFVGALVVVLLPERYLPSSTARREAPRTVEDDLAVRIHDVAYLLREMSTAFYEAAHENPPPTPMALVLEAINRRVCADCRHHVTCWQDGFYATYRSVMDIVAERPRGQPITADDLPGELRRICPRPREVALAISFAANLEAAEEAFSRREREMRALAADQIRGAAAVLERMREELLEPSVAKERLLTYATGLAKLAKGNGAVSGDSYLVRELQDGRLVLGLADGMGVGPKAFLESSAVVSMVEKLLSLGLGQELVLRTVNAALLMRSKEDIFSTLDLALLDLGNGELELIKIGSAPTFLCHGDEVEVLTSRSVPIGILREVQWEVFYRRLCPGDVLVMVSDGVAELGAHQWLKELLPSLATLDPQEIAERLLDEALARAGRRRDDMTVLATALADAASEEPPEIQAWVRRSWPVPSISMEHAGNTGQARGR